MLSFSASDVEGVSTISAAVDSTTTINSGGTVNIYTLTAGAHAILIKATDGLGNASTLTVTIQVHATIAGLVNAVNYGAGIGLIASQTKSQLLATLQSAQTALNGGNNAAAKSYLNTFVSQVNSAAANKITPSFASLLVNWTQDLIARL